MKFLECLGDLFYKLYSFSHHTVESNMVFVAVILLGLVVIFAVIFMDKLFKRFDIMYISRNFGKKNFLKSLNSAYSNLDHSIAFYTYKPNFIKSWTSYKLPMGCFSKTAKKRICERFNPILTSLYKNITYNEDTLKLYGELSYELKYIIEEIYSNFSYVNDKWSNAKILMCDPVEYDKKAKDCWACEDALLERLDVIEEYFLGINSKITSVVLEDKKMKQLEKKACKELAKNEIIKKNDDFTPFVLTENVNILNKE